MIARLWRGQEGSGLILLLAFMMLAVPLVTASLGLASTLSIDSRVKTAILKGQYSSLGGYEHALYRLVHPPNNGYVQSFHAGDIDTYLLTVNGSQTTVSISALSEPPGEVPPPSADSERGVRTFVTVAPDNNGFPVATSTHTYTIRVENWSDTDEAINKILNELPPGFVYVEGSTLLNGAPFPDATVGGGGSRLTWLSVDTTLPPQGSLELTFDAAIPTPDEGRYCDEAFVMPHGMKTSSGKTAFVTIGSPINELCQGKAVVVSKTVDTPIAAADTPTVFTYAITVDNIGTADLNVLYINDRLPKFFTFVATSTAGDFTTAEPSITIESGRQKLTWNFTPNIDLPSGATMVHTFKAEATVASGDYWNEAWVKIIEIPDEIYTWPTAKVEAMGVFEITATDGKRSVFAEVWLGASSYVIGKLNVN